jgi:hypothetical protein
LQTLKNANAHTHIRLVFSYHLLRNDVFSLISILRHIDGLHIHGADTHRKSMAGNQAR